MVNRSEQIRLVSSDKMDRLARWTERKPVIALMGEFSAGKSTLMNLLIGQSILPTQVTATQLPPVWLRYGTDAPYRIDNDGKRHAVDLNDLSSIPVKTTRFVRIYCKSDILEKCDLLDTPGISDPRIPTKTWIRTIGYANAVLWCTHAGQAWRESERSTWEGLPERLRQHSLLMVTRADKLVSQNDRDKIDRRLERETSELFSGRHFIALTNALASRDFDPDAWAESGAEAFMAHFDDILSSINSERGNLLWQYQIDDNCAADASDVAADDANDVAADDANDVAADDDILNQVISGIKNEKVLHLSDAEQVFSRKLAVIAESPALTEDTAAAEVSTPERMAQEDPVNNNEDQASPAQFIRSPFSRPVVTNSASSPSRPRLDRADAERIRATLMSDENESDTHTGNAARIEFAPLPADTSSKNIFSLEDQAIDLEENNGADDQNMAALEANSPDIFFSRLAQLSIGADKKDEVESTHADLTDQAEQHLEKMPMTDAADEQKTAKLIWQDIQKNYDVSRLPSVQETFISLLAKLEDATEKATPKSPISENVKALQYRYDLR